VKYLLLVVLFTSTVFGAEFIVKDENKGAKKSTWIALPYVFSSDSMGLTGGVVGIFNGFFQPQMSMVFTAFVGEELAIENINASGTDESQTARSEGFLFAISGYKPSFSKRTFITAIGSYAYYPNQKLYLNGRHDSIKSVDNRQSVAPLSTQGYNNWLSLDFRYVLPIGEAKDDITPLIKLNRGIAVNRDNVGNGVPFISGQTSFGTEFFYNIWTADKFTHDPSLSTNGVRFYLEHDNTDYPDNPSRGYNMLFRTSLDFGLGSSTQSWSCVEAEYSHYLELKNFSWSRQNVIALNAWSAYSPSWNQSQNIDDGEYINSHQPPMWEGAKLGGFKRLRAYDMNRFSDKAALYFGAEYRVIPTLNPMQGQKWNPIPIDWFQVVLFAEAGRVASDYDLMVLTDDMKYDAGFSIRALAAKLPVRFEMAFGDEGSNMWVMLKQPF